MAKFIALVAVAAFIGLFVYIFGFYVKSTDAYDCALTEARRNPAVIAGLGEPIEAGLFAWSSSYSQEGSVTDASFGTAVSGPKGKGWLSVRWYNSPVGSSMRLDFEKDGMTSMVYSGTIPCR